jgi:hypothetical protein
MSRAGELLVRIDLMATGRSRDSRPRLEGLAHYCELLLNGAPAALFRLNRILDRFYIGVRLKHRWKCL